MDYISHRPDGYEGQGDSHLPKIVRRLRRVLAETQSRFAYNTLRLPTKALGDLAGILVDFAEDIHAGTGIWASYERYNVQFFGSALPITTEQGDGPEAEFRPDPQPLSDISGSLSKTYDMSSSRRRSISD